MKKTKSLYHGHRFPAVVISCAVRWYFRFSLSLHDIEELLFERGVVVTYETIRCWCEKFGSVFRGRPYLLWGAVDARGAGLDVLVQKRRDKFAARRFFTRLLGSNPAPRKIVTDRLRRYPAAKADIPELAHVRHVFVKAAARVNNRAGNSHQPTCGRERQVYGFLDPKRTQAFLFSFGPVRQHFALPRHRMNALRHRIKLKARFTAWQRWTMAETRIGAN